VEGTPETKTAQKTSPPLRTSEENWLRSNVRKATSGRNSSFVSLRK
jgi:hypothetical protein